MDLRGYKMMVYVANHPEYAGIGDYFGSGRQRNRNSDQWVQFAEALASENEGILPCVSWIDKHHHGLYVCMLKKPGLFVHIPQHRHRRFHWTLKQWVAFAEILAAENGGVLPSLTRLQKIHNGLTSAMRRYPEPFAHIGQEIQNTRGRMIGYREPVPQEARGV